MEIAKEKPTHVKPNFYSYILDLIKPIAREMGYNIVVHGSMNRDLDLICIPWVDDPKPELEVIQAFDKCLTGLSKNNPDGNIPLSYMHSMLPGGRSNYIIQMARHGVWNNYEKDMEYYLDISFTPLVVNK